MTVIGKHDQSQLSLELPFCSLGLSQTLVSNMAVSTKTAFHSNLKSVLCMP